MVQRLLPVEHRPGVVAQLRSRGGDLVVRVVHPVRRMARGRAPLGPRAAEPLVAGAVLLLRKPVRARLELHRAEHAAVVRDEHARVGAVTRFDRAHGREQRPRDAGDRTPRLVERQVGARNRLRSRAAGERRVGRTDGHQADQEHDDDGFAHRLAVSARSSKPSRTTSGRNGESSGECSRLGFSKQQESAGNTPHTCPPRLLTDPRDPWPDGLSRRHESAAGFFLDFVPTSGSSPVADEVAPTPRSAKRLGVGLSPGSARAPHAPPATGSARPPRARGAGA